MTRSCSPRRIVYLAPHASFWGDRPERRLFHPHDPGPGVSRSPRYPPACPRTISHQHPVKARNPSICAQIFLSAAVFCVQSLCCKRCVTRQLGSPGEHARWGSGFDSPWRGGGGPPLLRAPTVAKHLVSAPPTSCHVSSPRLHARVASRAAPALAPPLPHHTRPPLSSARHLLPLALSRRRGLKTVDFWGRRKVRPRALPLTRPRSPFERLYGHCG